MGSMIGIVVLAGLIGVIVWAVRAGLWSGTWAGSGGEIDDGTKRKVPGGPGPGTF